MTSPARRQFETWLAWAFLPFVAVSVVALALVFVQQNGQLRRATARVRHAETELVRDQRQLRVNALATCLATNKARAQANTQVRIPLKEALKYLADLGRQGLQHPSRPLTVRQRQLTEDFVQKFQGYSDAVTIPVPFNCARLNQQEGQ